MTTMQASAFVLTFNEIANLGRCLLSWERVHGIEGVTVLDSGSTDGTLEVAARHDVISRSYAYRDHCTAYNDITEHLAESEYCFILDADMLVSDALVDEAIRLLKQGADVVLSPVDMVYAGRRLRHASLYPPKPWGFRTGSQYFRPAGHGEELHDGLQTERTRRRLTHDDHKPYAAFLESQLRYARTLRERASGGERCSILDRLRLRTPLGIVAVPLLSLVGKVGFLDGRAGLLYALDRLIAEAIIYGEALRERRLGALDGERASFGRRRSNGAAVDEDNS